MFETIRQYGAVVWDHVLAGNWVEIALLWGTILVAAVVTYVRANRSGWSLRDSYQVLTTIENRKPITDNFSKQQKR